MRKYVFPFFLFLLRKQRMQPPCTSRTIRPLGLKTAGSHEIFVFFFSPPIFQRHVILFPPNSSLTYFPPHTVYHYAFLSNLVRFVFLAKKEGRERENYTCAYKQRIDRSACKRSKIFMTGLVKKGRKKRGNRVMKKRKEGRKERNAHSGGIEHINWSKGGTREKKKRLKEKYRLHDRLISTY